MKRLERWGRRIKKEMRMNNYIILGISISVILFNCISYSDNTYTRVTIGISDSSITDSNLGKLIQILSKRFELYEVDNVTIKKITKNSLQIEFPNSSNQINLAELIERRGLLEFSLMPDVAYTFSIMRNIDSVLGNLLVSEKLLNDSISAREGSNENSDLDAYREIQENWRKDKEKFKREHPFFAIAYINLKGKSNEAYVKTRGRDLLEQMLKEQKVQDIIPEEVEFRFSAYTFQDKSGNYYYRMYLVNKDPVLTGDIITDAYAGGLITSTPKVTLEMNPEGAKEWARITGDNIGKRIAICLDGEIYVAPVVKGRIPNGRSQIDDIEKLDEAKTLAIILKSGTLPCPLKIIKEESIVK